MPELERTKPINYVCIRDCGGDARNVLIVSHTSDPPLERIIVRSTKNRCMSDAIAVAVHNCLHIYDENHGAIIDPHTGRFVVEGAVS